MKRELYLSCILKVDPHIRGQLIFKKSIKAISGERMAFSINGAGTTVYPYAKEFTSIHMSYTVQKLLQNIL